MLDKRNIETKAVIYLYFPNLYKLNVFFNYFKTYNQHFDENLIKLFIVIFSVEIELFIRYYLNLVNL